MTPQATIEERLQRLEEQYRSLVARVDKLTGEDNWLERISGSMKDEPAFEEAMRLGAEIRRADRPPDED